MTTAWWQHGVVYQVYPRSFQDSNGDGIGDLRGLTSRLDYLADLGIDAIWISPIFPSPMVDFGYDVLNYCDIDPCFGTLADFDDLLAAAHVRNLKVILDFVTNHTSNRHPWFVESKRGRTSRKRDWYVWRDPAPGGGPPNNWISDFGGSAWEWDEASGQYYLHAFLPEQPDLDWQNPDVRSAMYDVLRFWFERGVDGFRIDVLWHLIKAPGLPDNPPNPNYRPGMGEMYRVEQVHSTDQPEVHEIAAEMRRIADGYGDRVLIGEVYLPLERLMHYYGHDGRGVHLPFNFQLVDASWNAKALRELIASYEGALPDGAWPNWVLGNHDRPRIASRVGEARAGIAAMLLLTLRGTPTMYYGDELGLADVEIPREQVRDPRELREPGVGLGRDPVRSPMPWDASVNAGFTTGEPWLPLNADHGERNVARLDARRGSILALYRRLLALRRQRPALAVGRIALLESLAPDVLAYERSHGDERVLVVLNFGEHSQEIVLPPWVEWQLVSTHTPGEALAGERLFLDANEGVVLA